jgi:hypothetical protein
LFKSEKFWIVSISHFIFPFLCKFPKIWPLLMSTYGKNDKFKDLSWWCTYYYAYRLIQAPFASFLYGWLPFIGIGNALPTFIASYLMFINVLDSVVITFNRLIAIVFPFYYIKVIFLSGQRSWKRSVPWKMVLSRGTTIVKNLDMAKTVALIQHFSLLNSINIHLGDIG